MTPRVSARLGTAAAIGALLFAATTGVVWFVGFDVPWAIAAALTVLSVGAVLGTLAFDGPAPWDPPAPPTPRGARLAAITLAQAGKACDRLAQPRLWQWLRALHTGERDDRLARLALVRQLRALVVAELLDRGLDAVAQPEAAAAMLGPAVLPLLEANDRAPVTTAAIARVLEAIDRLQPIAPTRPHA